MAAAHDRAAMGRAPVPQPPAVGRAKVPEREPNQRLPWSHRPVPGEPPEEDPPPPPIGMVPREIRVRGRGPGGRSPLPIVVVLILAAAFGGAVFFGTKPGMELLVDLIPSTFRGGSSAGSSGAGGSGSRSSAMRASTPKRLSIAAIGVDAEVVEVGRALDGSIAAPQRDPVHHAGWYAGGPTPGEAGTAVIVGHVDTAREPAVFARLRTLTPGTKVEVHRHDGRTATFQVESVEYFPKNQFPARRVFADSPHPRLALITCGGPWAGGNTGYASNVIVFATLV